MYIILTYDISSKRVAKAMKICRKYLRHVQKSVFEGTVTQAKVNQLKVELQKVIVPSEDSILMYEFESLRFTSKEHIGKYEEYTNII